MKHIGPPGEKIFYVLVMICFVALCVPANAMADQSVNNNMIPAGSINLAVSNSNLADNFGPAFHYYDFALNSSVAPRAGNTVTAMKEGVANLARNSVWRLARLNAANENFRLYYFSIDLADAIVPRKTMLPLLN